MVTHERLSDKLAQMIETDGLGDGATVNHLLERTGGRGFYLVVILLALPFIVRCRFQGSARFLA